MRILFIVMTVFSISDTTTIAAQQNALPAVDVTAKSIESFIKALPADAVSDRPIRVVDVGSHRVGVWVSADPRILREMLCCTKSRPWRLNHANWHRNSRDRRHVGRQKAT